MVNCTGRDCPFRNSDCNLFRKRREYKENSFQPRSRRTQRDSNIDFSSNRNLSSTPKLDLFFCVALFRENDTHFNYYVAKQS